jgi:hypothetical protein
VSAAGRRAGRHVTLHVWRVPRTRLPRVLWRMSRDAGRMRRLPGVAFAKLLGTGRGWSFGPSQVDPGRWAAVLSWDDARAAADFDDSAVARDWRRLASGYCRLDLSPQLSQGRWAGQTPFEAGTGKAGTGNGETGNAGTRNAGTGTVLALTRARLRPGRTVGFWRAIRPVAAAAGTAPGLLATFGFGEAPVGWQGTVSVWRSSRDLVEFAYHRPEHRRAIDATPVRRWYAEELFARFAVMSVTGDRSILGWMEEDSPRNPTKAAQPKAAQTKEAP